MLGMCCVLHECSAIHVISGRRHSRVHSYRPKGLEGSIRSGRALESSPKGESGGDLSSLAVSGSPAPLLTKLSNTFAYCKYFSVFNSSKVSPDAVLVHRSVSTLI
jgi:hypothetical protein